MDSRAHGGAPRPALLEPVGEGLRRDFRGRFLPNLASDLADGLNLKCLASVLFMAFACLAPAVAFGGLLEVQTQGAMGAFEMITATSLCGCVYALCSGQPMTIIGSTGPVLAFTTILYSVSQQMGLPFFPVYAWTGLWSAGMLGVCALTSASNLVRYLTRFTDEVFSGLISAIFVFEAAKSLGALVASPAVAPAEALLSVVLALATFAGAMVFRDLRAGPYFPRPVREALSDFGPTLSIIAATCLAWAALAHWPGVSLDFLKLPATLAPSGSRPWLVDLWAVPLSVRLGSVVPAFMLTILMFFDQNITTRLVNSKDNRMVKGEAYHQDMAVVAALMAAMSVMGLPWLVAATVRSINHLKSLATTAVVLEEGGPEGGAGGGAGAARIVAMQEQRVTNFGIHLAVGLSLLFGRGLLTAIPQAVLMGLFLYLGISAIRGNQFLERVGLLFMERSRMPKAPWTTQLPLSTTNRYTLLQIASLVALYQLKESRIGILFPALIGGLQLILIAARRAGWFSDADLEVLDTE